MTSLKDSELSMRRVGLVKKDLSFISGWIQRNSWHWCKTNNLKYSDWKKDTGEV